MASPTKDKVDLAISAFRRTHSNPLAAPVGAAIDTITDGSDTAIEAIAADRNLSNSGKDNARRRQSLAAADAIAALRQERACERPLLRSQSNSTRWMNLTDKASGCSPEFCDEPHEGVHR
jgi:hypothetical protein